MTADLVLSPSEVHVWRIALRCVAGEMPALMAGLSAEERQRAEAQASDRLRRRFVAAHAGMRNILARYLNEKPGRLRFAAGPEGKPRLEGIDKAPRFNLSHSGELALLAVSPDRELGVDVEWMDPRRDLGALAQAFTAEERGLIEGLPAALRPGAYFQTWTRKEAFLKAMGSGLAKGLDAVTGGVSWADPDGPPGLEAGAAGTPRWTLVDLDCGPYYRAALAAEGSGWEALLVGSAEP